MSSKITKEITCNLGNLISESSTFHSGTATVTIDLSANTEYLNCLAQIPPYATITSCMLSANMYGSNTFCDFSVKLDDNLISATSGNTNLEISSSTIESFNLTNYAQSNEEKAGHLNGNAITISIGKSISSKYCKNVQLVWNITYYTISPEITLNNCSSLQIFSTFTNTAIEVTENGELETEIPEYTKITLEAFPKEHYHFDNYYFHYADYNDSASATMQDNPFTYITHREDFSDNYIVVNCEIDTFPICFVNYNGTELQITNFDYGALPTYDSETPLKAADVQYTYTFSGWLPEITEVTEEATYVAQYDAVLNSYPLVIYSWAGGNITPSEGTYEYGTEVELTATPKDGFEFIEWLDGVTSSIRTITIDEHSWYGAKFKLIPRYYYEGRPIKSIWTNKGKTKIVYVVDGDISAFSGEKAQVNGILMVLSNTIPDDMIEIKMIEVKKLNDNN